MKGIECHGRQILASANKEWSPGRGTMVVVENGKFYINEKWISLWLKRTSILSCLRYRGNSDHTADNNKRSNRNNRDNRFH